MSKQALRCIMRGYLFFTALFTVVGLLSYGLCAVFEGKFIGILILSAFGLVVLTGAAYSIGREWEY
jgi:hypothetical protein